MATKKKTEKVATPAFPYVVAGTHLNVTHYEDGKTELTWDDEQLLKEVREAIASVELAAMKPSVRAKAVSAKKKKEK